MKVGWKERVLCSLREIGAAGWRVLRRGERLFGVSWGAEERRWGVWSFTVCCFIG